MRTPRGSVPRSRPFVERDEVEEEEEEAGPGSTDGPTAPGHSTDGRDVAEKHHRKTSERGAPGVPRRGRPRRPARG